MLRLFKAGWILFGFCCGNPKYKNFTKTNLTFPLFHSDNIQLSIHCIQYFAQPPVAKTINKVTASHLKATIYSKKHFFSLRLSILLLFLSSLVWTGISIWWRNAAYRLLGSSLLLASVQTQQTSRCCKACSWAPFLNLKGQIGQPCLLYMHTWQPLQVHKTTTGPEQPAFWKPKTNIRRMVHCFWFARTDFITEIELLF